jgi:anti-sigma factor RsiW
MPDCNQLEPLVTPYVDGELTAADRTAVDAHLSVCPPCRLRILGERAVRDLLRARRASLAADCAPGALRQRCLAARRAPAAGAAAAAAAWTRRLAPLALAAALVLLVGGTFVYELTERSTAVMAAELTADHVKCFGLNSMMGAHADPAAAQSTLASVFGWHLDLPRAPANLELVSARPCLYGEGRVAHVMYRHNGHPVSVFMLPHKVRPEEVMDVMGHQVAIWSFRDRTFVLIAREPRPEVERMASYVQASMR